MNEKLIRNIAFDCYSTRDNDFDTVKFAELIIKDCLELNEILAYSFAQGNCFGDVGNHNGTALFESVTRPFGDEGIRHFDPIGIAEYFNKRIKEHFGVK